MEDIKLLMDKDKSAKDLFNNINISIQTIKYIDEKKNPKKTCLENHEKLKNY